MKLKRILNIDKELTCEFHYDESSMVLFVKEKAKHRSLTII